MSKIATKAIDNVFYQARFEASKYHEKLSSREGAAEEVGMDRTRLARIELGSLIPYPEEVLLMADLYDAPELKNFYCRTTCPLGRDVPKVELENLDRISVKALSTFRKMTSVKETLLDIVEDGVVSEDEKPELESVMSTLDEVASIAQTLKIWVEKNLG